jgi:hypothetical protein
MDSRFQFVTITEEIFRQLGFDPPEMNQDKFLPLAMELEIDKIEFELIHSTNERLEELIVLAKIEEIRLEDKDNFLTNLMKINLELARNYAGCFGVDPNSKKIIFLTSRVLEKIDGVQLLQDLRDISKELKQWISKLLEFNDDRISENEIDISFSLA